MIVGQTISHYRILDKLGAGGMGVVYKAEDTRLRRTVALKFLPPHAAENRERFLREAQAAAALNHPNICVVHEIDEEHGFLAMELIDNVSVRDKIAARPLPLEEALDIARQVCAGLQAAHEKGVVHRDIKPANLMLTAQGQVKIMDFGLAQVGDRTRITKTGSSLGTPAYMSPEQAEGKATDRRTDLWSLGVVLYEMVAGRLPFAGETDAAVSYAIVHGEAEPLSAVRTGVPLELDRIVAKMLAKDPAERYQHADDLAADLRRLPPRTTPTKRRRAGWWVVPATAVLAGAAGWFLHESARKEATGTPVHVRRLTDGVGLEETPAIAPDGKTVAFVAESGGKRQIWLRLLAGGGTPLKITNIDKDPYSPRWSPDSGSIIYYTSGPQPGDPGVIWEIPAFGGPSRRVIDALGPGDLSHDGKWIAFIRFRDGSPELAVAARDGSQARTILKLTTGVYYSHPRWAPDDRAIAFQKDPHGVGFYSSLALVDISSHEMKTIPNAGMLQGFTWMPDGTGLIVSSAEGSAMPYPPIFNLWTTRLDGGARSQLSFGEASYEFPDAGRDGSLVVSRVRAQSDVWKLPVTGEPADNARNGTRITRQTGQVQTVSVNADDSEVVFLSDNGGHANVWVARVADGVMRPLTRESDARVVVAVPLWSPRGDLINFLSSRNSKTLDVALWLVKPDGSEPRNLGIRGAWACWSDDGRWLYFSVSENEKFVIKKVGIEGGEPVKVRSDNAIGCATAGDGSLFYAKVLTQATGTWDFEIRAARPENAASEVVGRLSGSRVPAGAGNFQVYLSPDGKWLAAPLLDGPTTNLWALSTGGGGWRKLTDFGSRNVIIARRIAWSKDGRHLFASVSDVDSDIVMIEGLRW